MRAELAEQVRAAAEVGDLDRLAERRAASTLQRIAALEAFVVAAALPRWGGLSGEYHQGVLAALRGLVQRPGRLVTGRLVLAEVEAEIYEWAQSVGLTPTTEKA